ncbi:MAG: DHH family phosphoesterase [Verrucomicrobia bacterium]|nr:DHH family phosphoesterase [Verrucomicrobiota bacterium]
MINLPRPEVILTHESDLDGLVSGLLLQRLGRRLFGVEIPIEAYHNHNWRQRSGQEPSAWVADFSFEARLDRLNWVIIDHHPPEATPQRARLIHDPAKSAGLLCYELCQAAGLATPTLDRLVHLNNVADLFLVEDPDFALAGDYANLVKTYQFWNLYELVGGDPERLLDHPLLEVMAVKRRIEDPLGLAWSQANVTRLSSEVGYVETVIGNVNLIVHQLLADAATPYPVLMTLFRKGNGTIIASLRSRNGEALKVAERLQGGGHPNAAGTTLPRFVRQIPDALDYLRTALNPTVPAPDPGLPALESAFEARVKDQRAAS